MPCSSIPRLSVRPVGAVGLKTKDTGDNAFDFAVVAVDQFGTRHARENLDAQLFGLLGHPAADIAHRNDVVAVVVHQRWHRRKLGMRIFARFAQHVEVVFFAPARSAERLFPSSPGSACSDPTGSRTAP